MSGGVNERWVVRRLAVAVAVAIVGTLLSLPAVITATAAPASAADVPTCAPGQTGGTYGLNCIPADNLYDGTKPPINDLTPPVSAGGVLMRQTITVTGAEIGGLCPSGGIPFSRLPCTMRGVNAGGRVYVPGGTEAGSPSGYGVNIGSDPNVPYADSCSQSVSHTCTLWITYNPALFTGTLQLIIGVSTTVVGDLNGDGNILDGIGYSFTISISGTGTTPPTANFTVAGAGTADQPAFFQATSVDPGGSPLSHQWDFGDGGTAIGSPVSHVFTTAGNHSVKLTSTNLQGRSGTVTKTFTVSAAKIGLIIELLDGAAPPLAPDEPVRAKVTVAAGNGLGAVTGIRFTDDALLKVSPAGAFAITDGPTPALPTGGFSLNPGQSRSFEATIEPQILGRYALSSQVTGTDSTGQRLTADASSPGEIGEALKIGITLDPPNADQEEGPDGPIPIDVTATIEFENTTDVVMDAVTMRSLRVDRTKAGQLLAVSQTGGADPGDDGLAIGALNPGQKKSVTATFRATDDSEVEFSAMATAHTVDGRTEIGLGKKKWSVKPKYLLGLTTRVTNPAGTALLPAGELIRVAGTVKNLSTTATVEVGALYPTVSGNAGVMSLAWDTTGSDPNATIPVGNLVLEPGESADFTVRILTTWSDPTRITGTPGTSGTRADITFTPYGKATLEDGTEKVVTPDDVKAAESDLHHRVAIDDSIAIPTFEWGAWLGAISVGTVQGLGSAAASIVTGVVDLVKAPFTITAAVYAAQAQIWDSFTDEEKEEFANDAGLMAAAILMRNAEQAQKGSAELLEQVRANTLTIMTDLENQWQVGDYTQTAQAWSRWGADAIGQVVIPVALAKLAKSPRVAAALARAQAELQTRMAPVLQSTMSATRIEQLGPILLEIASGTELSLAELEKLYAITAEEYAELKKLADKYGVLMTVRSRHASSIKWIEEKLALLKPEAIKIKTVSELDEILGYPADTIGSLVFAKPEVLKIFEAGTRDLGTVINEFVQSKGFVEGTVEWENAVKRVGARLDEWTKWEKTYKQWDAQGWVDVSFNYEGNAIGDSVRKGKSGLGIAPLSSGKYRQFRLRPIGEEQYVVEMYNPKAGRFVPVTGDIDPIAFTHLDGSPLTVAEHANLLDDLAGNPLLQGQHGESATFKKGGLDFIESQFKAGEPGLQIAPGDSAARVVRFNKGGSRWNTAEDYHLKWDGGFEYSGSYVPKTARPRAPIVVQSPVEAPPRRVSAIPKATSTEPNVGRCRITYGTAPGNASAVVDAAGKLRRLAGDGTLTDDDSLHSECFSPGPTVEKELKPVTGLIENAIAGETELEIPDDPYLAEAGSDIEVGDRVVVGAGTPGAETHTVTGFGSIIIDGGLEKAWSAGTIIVVIKSAQPGTTTSTTTTSTTTTSVPGSTTTTVQPGSTTSTTVQPGSTTTTTECPPEEVTTTTAPHPTTTAPATTVPVTTTVPTSTTVPPTTSTTSTTSTTVAPWSTTTTSVAPAATSTIAPVRVESATATASTGSGAASSADTTGSGAAAGAAPDPGGLAVTGGNHSGRSALALCLVAVGLLFVGLTRGRRRHR